MKKVLLTLTVLIASQFASAEDSSPAWLCNMNFNGKLKGFQLIVGKTSFHGKGTIACVGVTGEQVTLPINMDIETSPVSPTLALAKMKVAGVALNISLFNMDPQNILGDYLIVQGGFSAGVGAGAFVAMKRELPELNLNVSLELTHGLGVQVGIQKMTISLDESRL